MVKERLAKRVLKNTIYNTLSALVAKMGGILITIFLARLLLPELFGVYSLVISIAFFISPFTDLGVSGVLIKYVAEALGKIKKDVAVVYFQYLLKLKIIFAMIVSVGLFILAQPISVFVFGKAVLILPFKIVALFIFVYAIYNFFSSVFTATQQFKFSTIGSAVYESMRVILAPTFVLIGWSVFGAICGLIIATILATIVLVYYLVKHHKYFFLKKVTPLPLKKTRIWKFMIYLMIGSLSAIMFTYVDSIMLGIFMPIEYVGFYRAAFAIVFGIAGFLTITNVLFPVFTQLEGDNLKKAFQKVFRYTAILTFPSAFGLIYVAQPFVQVVYGIDYLPTIVPLIILSFLIIESTLGSFFTTVFIAKELPQYPTYLMITASILNVVLNYFLILAYGMAGAAIATVISRFFNSIFLGILAKIKLNIAPILSSIYKPLLASIIMLIALMLIPLQQKISIVALEIIFGAIVYFVALFALKGIERDDILYIRNIFKS